MKTRNLRAGTSALLGAVLVLAVGLAYSCGPRAMHRSGGHHHGMHQVRAAAAMPVGTNPAALPDAGDAGARLLAGYCTQCHGLPHPEMHLQREWPEVAGRMYRHMQQFEGRVSAPSEAEWGAILAYLQEHARDLN